MRFIEALRTAGVMLVLSAAVTATADEIKDEDLGTVVVTATKTAEDSDKIANSTTVITEEEIKEKGHRTIAEALAGQPGISLAQSGGPGTSTSVFMRGAESKNVLLLVDGIPYQDPSSPNRNSLFSHLTTTNVQRIEIVRGPQSVLYGSNATAGVINVITKNGDGKPTVTIRSEAGSYKTFQNGISSSGSVNRLKYSLGVNYLDIGGYSIADEDNVRLDRSAMTGENDSYRNLTYSGMVSYNFSDAFEVSLTGREMESKVESDYPPFDTNAEYHTTDQSLRIDIKSKLGEQFTSKFYASYFNSERWDYAGSSKGSTYEGKTEQYGWQGDFHASNGMFITSIGGDLTREFADTAAGLSENADTRSAWLQQQLEVGNFYASLGGRYDRHDRFGEFTTYRVAPAYRFESDTRIKASYGTGYRAPSLYEMYTSAYYPGWPGFFPNLSISGNPDLEPERSVGWDIGIEQYFGSDAMIGVTYFCTEFDDKIEYTETTYDIPTDTQYATYLTVDGLTKTCGAEVAASWRASEKLSFNGTYTYTDTKSPSGARLIRVPLHQAMLTTNHKISDKVGTNLILHWVGERDTSPYAPSDKNGNPIDHMQEYFLVHLNVYYLISENLKFTFRIHNLTDEQYEHALGYATPDRSYYLGAELTF